MVEYLVEGLGTVECSLPAPTTAIGRYILAASQIDWAPRAEFAKGFDDTPVYGPAHDRPMCFRLPNIPLDLCSHPWLPLSTARRPRSRHSQPLCLRTRLPALGNGRVLSRLDDVGTT